MSTRKKILDAMYDLVAEVGYDKASIGKICDFVGISKPSVYYYFPSKEEIFTTLLDSMFPTIDYQRDYSLIVDRDGFKAALIELGNSVIGGYRSDEKRRRVLAEVSVQANRIPAVQERQATATKRTMDALKDILLHGVEIGAFSDSAKSAQILAKLKSAGLPAFSEKVSTPKGELTRIRIGPTLDESRANEWRKKSESAGVPGKVVR